jgi:hypothetical protein
VEYIPEVRDDLVASVSNLLVLLGSALGDLEAVLGEDTVAGVGAASDLAAVDTVAQDLERVNIGPSSARDSTYAGLAVA